MPTNLKVSVGTIKTYPVILGYNALTFEQQTHLAEEQGWYESDFPNPRQERFWVIDGDIFSEEMDLIRLGALAFEGWQYQYYCRDESFLARFSKDLNTIEVAKVLVEGAVGHD